MNNAIIIAITGITVLLVYRLFRYRRNKAEYYGINGRLNKHDFMLNSKLNDMDARKKYDENVPEFLFEPPANLPLEDVIRCFDKVLVSEKFKHHKSCFKCGLKSDQLVWIDFTSPGHTWRNLCGRRGPVSICPVCNIQVEFILECLS